MKRLVMVLVVGMIGTGFSKDPGETAMAFLKLGQGARVAGMGEAFVGLADDINALYWNPAGLAQLREKEATFMYLKPFIEVNGLGYSYIATAIPRKRGDTLAFSLAYFGYGDEKRTDGSGNPIGDWNASDIALSAALAGKPQDNLLVGGAIKLIQGNIDDSNATGVACDVGCLYFPKIKDTKLGIVIKNIGTKIKFGKESNPLPLQLKLGLSHRLPKDLAPVVITLDATVPNDNDPYVGLGAEYSHKAFSVRAGFKSGPQKDSGFTAGFSINHNPITFDFAYQPQETLGDSYFVSLSAKY
ncbi:PorV/PorQ family protein [bacterium]|nr:PorV/PorQ family protein [bacterium]MBU2461523.1 PorV/PorQ family protein [bacterium]